LVGYADFCRLIQYGAVATLAISGVTGPILIIFAHDVATILPLNIFELELAYLYPFQNASLLNKGHLANFLHFAQNWLPWHSHKYLPFGEKNRANRSSRSRDSFAQIKKGTTEGKIYSPVGKFSKRTKTDFYCLQNVRKPENEKYRSPNKHCKTHDIFLKDKTRFDRTATQK